MMKQSLYLIIFLPITIIAQIGIGITNPSASLEVQTSATGIPALRIEPQTNPVGVANGQMTVIDNKLFLFSETRDKWLSAEQTVLEFGRLGSGSDPEEIEFGGGDIQQGPIMPFDGTIVGVALSATEDDNQRDISLFINGVAIPNNDLLPSVDGSFNLDPITLNFINSQYDIDFAKGDLISLAVDNGVNDIDDLIVNLIIKWRKENP